MDHVGVRALDRHVLDVALDLVAGVRQFDDEGRILLVARRVRIGLGHHQRHVGDAGGGGEPFFAVEDVIFVAVLHRRGLHARGIGAGRLLGHREADALVAVEQRLQEFFLLIVACRARGWSSSRRRRGPACSSRARRACFRRAPSAPARWRAGRGPCRHIPSARTGTTDPARAPWRAAGPAPHRAAWCPVPFPRGCILPAPIGAPLRGSPWLRPGLRNRSTWRFPRCWFLVGSGLGGWHISGASQRQRQTMFKATRVNPRACGLCSTPRRCYRRRCYWLLDHPLSRMMT